MSGFCEASNGILGENIPSLSAAPAMDGWTTRRRNCAADCAIPELNPGGIGGRIRRHLPCHRWEAVPSVSGVNEFQPLIDRLYREEILRARRMTPAERIAGVFELTRFAHSMMEAGIRAQYPGASEAEVLELREDASQSGVVAMSGESFAPWKRRDDGGRNLPGRFGRDSCGASRLRSGRRTGSDRPYIHAHDSGAWCAKHGTLARLADVRASIPPRL